MVNLIRKPRESSGSALRDQCPQSNTGSSVRGCPCVVLTAGRARPAASTLCRWARSAWRRRCAAGGGRMGEGRAPTAHVAIAGRWQMEAATAATAGAESGASGAPPRSGGRWAIRRVLGRVRPSPSNPPLPSREIKKATRRGVMPFS